MKRALCAGKNKKRENSRIDYIHLAYIPSQNFRDGSISSSDEQLLFNYICKSLKSCMFVFIVDQVTNAMESLDWEVVDEIK